MWRRFSCFFAISCLVAIACVLRPLSAQAPVTAEIDVAGPWSFATDPNDETRVVIIAPNLALHTVGILSGGDVGIFTGAFKPSAGSYTLQIPNFDHMKCQTATPPPLSSGPYRVSVLPTTVKTALGLASVFAISLPMPCSYESYVEARAKIDTNAITAGTPEGSYSTWLVLHYVLPNPPSPTSVVNSAGAIVIPKIAFNSSPSTHPSTSSYAISLVLFDDGSMSEDSVCDQHSADTFDGVVKGLWGQSSLYRLFPELYMPSPSLTDPQEQTHRYHLDTCHTSISAGHAAMAPSPGRLVIDSIQLLRGQLRDLKYDGALKTLEQVQAQLNLFWHERVPKPIEDDVANARTAITQAQDRKTCTILDENSVLGTTIYLMTVGRIDCHAPQVSINGAIP